MKEQIENQVVQSITEAYPTWKRNQKMGPKGELYGGKISVHELVFRDEEAWEFVEYKVLGVAHEAVKAFADFGEVVEYSVMVDVVETEGPMTDFFISVRVHQPLTRIV